jgi:hypothetical protein
LFAVTVSVEELPAAIEVGLALMVTVGARFTVTVAVEEIWTPPSVAVAVYVVVVLGLTDSVPPATPNV